MFQNLNQCNSLPDVVSKYCWMSGKQLDPDETPRSAASHLGLYCLLRPVCPNTYGKYSTFFLQDLGIQLLPTVQCQYGQKSWLINYFLMEQSTVFITFTISLTSTIIMIMMILCLR